MASIEELYKYYETLTDSKEKAGQVNISIIDTSYLSLKIGTLHEQS